MSWVCNLSNSASKDLRKIPRDYQILIAQAIDEMKLDPFTGDVCPIKSGTFKGCFRRRVGKYRIIFDVNHTLKIVLISRILRRGDTTYE